MCIRDSCYSWSFFISYWNHISYLILNLPLPDADSFFQESFDVANLEIQKYVAALLGILITITILRALTSK